jgi:hypothetical protein
MEDSLPKDIRLLFTREEFRQAMGFLFAPEAADAVTGAAYEPTGIGVALADGSLIALALLSDHAARRVVQYRPELEEMVRRIRADPETARASLQLAPPGQP